MPSNYSSQHSQDDAADLAQRIGAHYRVQHIAPMVDAFQSQLNLEGVAEENLQARVRGMTLMALSNSEGHLVLATGNKTELAVGYSTIYGDAVGGYAPIKDVDKSRVWQLSRWRNTVAVDRGDIPPIPESSITKPPSAELRPGQVDQDSLPPMTCSTKCLTPTSNTKKAGRNSSRVASPLRSSIRWCRSLIALNGNAANIRLDQKSQR